MPVAVTALISGVLSGGKFFNALALYGALTIVGFPVVAHGASSPSKSPQSRLATHGPLGQTLVLDLSEQHDEGARFVLLRRRAEDGRWSHSIRPLTKAHFIERGAGPALEWEATFLSAEGTPIRTIEAIKLSDGKWTLTGQDSLGTKVIESSLGACDTSRTTISSQDRVDIAGCASVEATADTQLGLVRHFLGLVRHFDGPRAPLDLRDYTTLELELRNSTRARLCFEQVGLGPSASACVDIAAGPKRKLRLPLRAFADPGSCEARSISATDRLSIVSLETGTIQLSAGRLRVSQGPAQDAGAVLDCKDSKDYTGSALMSGFLRASGAAGGSLLLLLSLSMLGRHRRRREIMPTRAFYSDYQLYPLAQ